MVDFADEEDPFPLGDGTADVDAAASCPYCGEQVTIALDPGSGDSQQYVEDCPVCCQPWSVTMSYDGTGGASVTLDALDR